MTHVFSLATPMAPPWLAFPSISRYSIGWRMGAGESYRYDFWDWYHGLSAEHQSAFRANYPEPKSWRGTYNDQPHTPSDLDGIEFWSLDGEPAYGIAQLRENQHLSSVDYLFFWGHRAAADGKITQSCFSQWWQSRFTVDITDFCCMEQYMMAAKAQLFEDEQIEKEILASQDPARIKALGRRVKNFDETRWNRYKYTIVLAGNYHKFSQDRRLFHYLLSTRDKVIVEASPVDSVWGIGLSQDAPQATQPHNWRGQNLLGFALMEVRDEIKRVYRYYDQIHWPELRQRYPGIETL
jgi:ribA/ribD-fused uncharacterized protein